MLAWHLPPDLYPEMPSILVAASQDSLAQLAQLADDVRAQLPADVRQKIREMLKQHESKPN